VFYLIINFHERLEGCKT